MSEAAPRHNRLWEYAQRHGLELHRGMLVRLEGVELRLCGVCPERERLALKRPQDRVASVWVMPDDPRVVLVPTDIAPRQPRRERAAKQQEQEQDTVTRQARAKAEHLAWLRGRMPSEALRDGERDFGDAPIAHRYGAPR